MAHTHHEPGHTTVVSEDSSTSVLAIVLITAVVALLAWFLFFSGIVFDRGDNDVVVPDQDRTEIRNEEGDTNIIQPDSGTDDGTTTDGTQQEPATAP